MELWSGAALMGQQYRALLRKNIILAWRLKRSTSLQLFSSLFFIFLIFCIDRAIRSRFASSTSYKNIYDSQAIVSLPIPPCEDKFFIKKPCFDFVWSDYSSARITQIVSAIMSNNPGRPIPFDKVKSFRPPEEVDPRSPIPLPLSWLGSHLLPLPLQVRPHLRPHHSQSGHPTGNQLCPACQSASDLWPLFELRATTRVLDSG